MSNHERRPGEPTPEGEPRPYVQAAGFLRERPARVAYQALQETVYANQCDLSVYRLQLEAGWIVAIVGAPPEERLDVQFRETLAVGESISLPGDIVGALMARRREANRQGPWVERHHRWG